LTIAFQALLAALPIQLNMVLKSQSAKAFI